MGWWGLIRMWDVQVEKQDLNKAGTPSPSRLLPLLHPKPIPAQALLVQADVATLISHRCCVPVDRCHWVGGARASRGSVVWVGCGSVRSGVVLPCLGPMEVGEKLELEDSLGSWPGGGASLCPFLLSL